MKRAEIQMFRNKSLLSQLIPKDELEQERIMNFITEVGKHSQPNYLVKEREDLLQAKKRQLELAKRNLQEATL